jgi:uncharacterized protein (TIGR02145 family)
MHNYPTPPLWKHFSQLPSNRDKNIMEVRRLFLIEQAKYENEMIMCNFLKQLGSSTTTTTQVVAESNILYGLLYNWYAVNDAGGIAPDGWRVATDDDWTILTNELGGASVAGGPLKSTELWNAPNTGATNSSGFSGLPGGFRNVGGVYDYLGLYGFWWSATASSTLNAWYRLMDSTASSVGRGINGKGSGFSVRCVSDTPPPAATVTDVTGNVYTWVQIGSKYWLAQNLATTKYNNGVDIPTGLDNGAWSSTTDGAYAYPNNDSNLVYI